MPSRRRSRHTAARRSSTPIRDASSPTSTSRHCSDARYCDQHGWQGRLARQRVRRAVLANIKYEEVYLRAYDSAADAKLRSGATSTFTTNRRPHRALAGQRPMRYTSPSRCSARQHKIGRGSTYRRGNSVQRSGATDEEWALVAPLIPPAKPGGGKRRTDMRAVVNGLMYILSTGCQWRYLPKDFPPHSTVYNYFVWWQCDRVLDRIHHALYVECRQRAEREASPTAAIIDSQSVKSAEKGGPASIRMASMPAS